MEQVIDLPLDVLLAPAADLDLGGVLRRTVTLACEQTGARDGLVAVFDDDGVVTELVTVGLSDDRAVELSGEDDRLLRVDEPTPTLAVPIRLDDRVIGRLLVADKEDRFTHDDELAVAALARVAAIAVRNARSFALSERRREWVEATARLAASLHPSVSMIEPLTEFVVGARRVTRGSIAAVVRTGEHGFDVAAADSRRPGELPALLADCDSLIRHAEATGELFETTDTRHGPVIGVPLDAELEFEGVLLIALGRDRGPLPAEERDLLTAYTTQGSFVLDRAVYLQARQQEVLAADRDRIAQDLHDVVIQRLFATGVQLRAARDSTDPAETRSRVDATVEDLETAIRDIRTTIFELQHGMGASLRSAVAALAREFTDVLGFSPTVHTWGPLNSLVPRPLTEQAMAVLREAVSNCARHAAASECVIEVSVADGWLTLCVTDDGCGLGEDVHESGLRNLRRRAERLGGVLELGPATPSGTLLKWRVPLPRQ